MSKIDVKERALATIQTISELSTIKDADSIEIAKVLGWQCVVLKNTFNIGDKAVYFEVDSFLPVESRYEFLRKSSFRTNDFMGSGFRIKTMKMRGELSQGLLLPLSEFPELSDGDTAIGTNVTELLNVKKYKLPEIELNTGVGLAKGKKPFGIPTTDEVRIQSAPELLTQIHNKAFYITTKLDGTSCTVYWKDGEFGCCSRNLEVKEDVPSLYWKPAQKYDLREKMNQLGLNIAIQGELCGPAIQKNRLKLKDFGWYVFDIFDLDKMEYYEIPDLIVICKRLNLTHVPIETISLFEKFNFSLTDLIELAKGKYSHGNNDKEGIVVRSYNVMPRTSFKVLNNDMLLKEKD